MKNRIQNFSNIWKNKVGNCVYQNKYKLLKKQNIFLRKTIKGHLFYFYNNFDNVPEKQKLIKILESYEFQC